MTSNDLDMTWVIKMSLKTSFLFTFLLFRFLFLVVQFLFPYLFIVLKTIEIKIFYLTRNPELQNFSKFHRDITKHFNYQAPIKIIFTPYRVSLAPYLKRNYSCIFCH